AVDGDRGDAVLEVRGRGGDEVDAGGVVDGEGAGDGGGREQAGGSADVECAAVGGEAGEDQGVGGGEGECAGARFGQAATGVGAEGGGVEGQAAAPTAQDGHRRGRRVIDARIGDGDAADRAAGAEDGHGGGAEPTATGDLDDGRADVTRPAAEHGDAGDARAGGNGQGLGDGDRVGAGVDGAA